MFLSAVAIADRSNMPTVTEHRNAVSQATADVIAIMAVTGPLLKLESSNERAILEGLFERIMAEDLPIHLPDKIGGGYRVPGITREEWRAISSAPLADMAQKRLEALAILQRKRMGAAAHMVATASMAEIKHAASQGSPSAKRTLKHVRAYADHPVYVQALNVAMVERAAKTTPTDPDGRRPTGWSSFRNRMSALLYRNPALEPVPIEERATELGGEVKSDKGAVSACATTSRDEAIAALATALHDDPAIRVVDRDGHLVIDTSGKAAGAAKARNRQEARQAMLSLLATFSEGKAGTTIKREELRAAFIAAQPSTPALASLSDVIDGKSAKTPGTLAYELAHMGKDAIVDTTRGVIKILDLGSATAAQQTEPAE